MKTLHNVYGTGKHDTFQRKMVQADALYDTQFSSLLLEFRNFKSYISQQKVTCHKNKKSLKSQFD